MAYTLTGEIDKPNSAQHRNPTHFAGVVLLVQMVMNNNENKKNENNQNNNNNNNINTFDNFFMSMCKCKI